MPEEVLQKAASELVCYQDTGMSVMEMSHRGAAFSKILQQAEADLRTLMHISDNYKVLFLQGGASLQFSMIPMNLMRKSFKADYINTGAWSKKAIKEAKKVGKVNVVASSEEDNFTHIPEIDRQNSIKRPITSTLSQTTLFTVRGMMRCPPRRRACRWWRMLPATSCPRFMISTISAYCISAHRKM